MTTGKNIASTRWTFVSKVMSLLFNMLSRLIIAFLPRSKYLLISQLMSPFAVILEPKKIKSVTVSIVSPLNCHEVMGPDDTILVFWKLSFKPAFHSPLWLSPSGSLVPLSFLPQGWWRQQYELFTTYANRYIAKKKQTNQIQSQRYVKRTCATERESSGQSWNIFTYTINKMLLN